MKIASARIQGFRAIADLELDFDDLTAFVGTGGVGKSAILNALDWFFRGGPLEERDLHVPAGAEEPAEFVMVAITFGAFNQADREALGRYGTGATTTLTRTWSISGEDKLSGNALINPEFEAIRSSGKGARDLRAAYVKLYGREGAAKNYPEPARGWPQIEAEMEQWEREHRDDCELVDTDAGRHFHGFTGTPLLASRLAYVLVGATAGASETLAARRGSALDQLLSAVEDLNENQRREIAEVQGEAQKKIKELVANARGSELVSLSGRLSHRVHSYFPGSAIKLRDEVGEPEMPPIKVRALVSDRHGHPIDPELQGHGLQRAIVIALLHELAQALPADGGEGDAHTASALMLAIEEPELYQHPLQARALATTLATLAESNEPVIQVAYSTHSPYFTSPALFKNLRLCRRDEQGGTTVTAANPAAIEGAIAEAGYSGDIAYKVAKALAEGLREAIFARAVLLTEGPTDTAFLQGIADTQGGLDTDGVAVAGCVNKNSMGIAIAILRQLGIPFFAFFDADAAGELSDEATLNRRLLRLCEEPEQDWPKREVRARSGNFADRLETDLEELWPAFADACKEAAEELKIKNVKDPRIYREAVDRAGEPPEFLTDVLEAARNLAA